ncbi:probable G-protein coupled receptor Mth-like 12 [Drosophila takahashii]|uniref:probable G-protein coupled receptor Mth-like 12 n=1 Tax=Drosophila takahashii TaxID=29030 RepID=UPI0038993D03
METLGYKEIIHLLYFLWWLILSIFSLIMFILTVNNIRKVKKELKKFEPQKETTTTCFSFNTEAYIIFLRMSFMTGVSLLLYSVLGGIAFCTGNVVRGWFKFFKNVYRACFGIFIFILLICKRSTIEMLMESIKLKNPQYLGGSCQSGLNRAIELRKTRQGNTRL